jgi:hypothetical protein
MNDTEFYRQLVGLVAPRQVSRVDLSAKEVGIDLWARPETHSLHVPTL